MTRLYGNFIQSLFYPALLIPTRSRAVATAREMRLRQRWPLERIQQWQLVRLRELVKTASSRSPFYRERLESFKTVLDRLESLEDFQLIPVTTKTDIESHFPDGMIIAEERAADWQYVGTRGTTHRVMVVQDFKRRDVGRAASMVAMTEDSPYRLGSREVTIPPDACSVHCGIESNRERSVSRQVLAIATGRLPWQRESISDLRGLVMDNWIRRSVSLPPLALDLGDLALARCIQTLRELRPVQLVALPEYLQTLAEYIHRTSDAPPPIPVVRPMGANMPASWKPGVADAFRGAVREHYGSREMGPMAFDCRYADGMHLLMDRHLIEIIKDGRPAQPGEIGQVLVTDLDNFAMPILRYQIGDLARMDYEPCRCGRQTPRIHLEGRLDDTVVTDDGRLLTPEAVSNFFHALPGVRDFQFVEDRNGRWSLRIVPDPGQSVDIQALVERFQEWSGTTHRLQARLTDTIRPESSGKFRHCKSSSFERLSREPVTR